MDASEASKIVATRGPEMGGNVLRQLLDAAINGVGRVPGAKATAANALVKQGAVEPAIDSLVGLHVRMATTQGILTNLGGLWTAPLLLPANIASLAIVQIRLVASVAHLRGYDVDDPRVRTAMSLCLIGETGVVDLLRRKEIPTTPMAIATAPVFDASLDRLVSEKVFADLASRLSGRQMIVLLARRIPLVGGGVSGAMDGWFTTSVGAFARHQFPSRRRLTARPAEAPKPDAPAPEAPSSAG